MVKKKKTNKKAIKEKFKTKTLEKESKNTSVVSLLIIFILVVAGGYAIYSSGTSSNDERELAILTTGVEYGYKTALLDIFNEADRCEPISLFNESVNITIIAIKCLSTP